jgi:hypothetical protein
LLKINVQMRDVKLIGATPGIVVKRRQALPSTERIVLQRRRTRSSAAAFL